MIESSIAYFLGAETCATLFLLSFNVAATSFCASFLNICILFSFNLFIYACILFRSSTSNSLNASNFSRDKYVVTLSFVDWCAGDTSLSADLEELNTDYEYFTQISVGTYKLIRLIHRIELTDMEKRHLAELSKLHVWIEYSITHY